MPPVDQPANRSAVCLVIDRLRARSLGCYGNSWYETPSFDRLAVESTVFDQCLADALEPRSLCRSWWLARHAIRPPHGDETGNSWLALLSETVDTILVTDQPEVVHSTWAAFFSEVIEVPRGRGVAPAVQHTQFARVTAVAADRLQSHHDARSARPYLLWIHAAGMNSCWDAPTSLRKSLADADDPLPGAETAVPSRRLPEEFDPDEVFLASCGYAAQVMAVDACLGELLDAARIVCGDDEPLWLVQGARGFPLGEHHRLGPIDESLYVESIHVPLLVRLPRAEQPLNRVQALIQPPDVAATLADWFGLPQVDRLGDGRSLLPLIHGRAEIVRGHALSGLTSGERGLRTPAWYLRRPHDGPAELYVKPDDLWDANDVSSRCEETVERMIEALVLCETALASHEPVDPPQLAKDLTEVSW
jgi:hypothetical protein